MDRHLRANELTVDVLRSRLLQRFPDADESNINKLRVVELLERCIAADASTAQRSANLICDAEVDATLPRRTHVVKAYLGTFVKDKALLANIDSYVISASLHWAFGTRLLNLGAIDLLGGRPSEATPVQRFTSDVDDATRAFFALLGRKTCKHAFTPDAWPIDANDDEEEEETLDPMVTEMWRLHRPRLAHLTRHNRLAAFNGNAGKWKSNVANNMRTRYITNVQNHAMDHINARVDQYLQDLTSEADDGGRTLAAMRATVFHRRCPLILGVEDYGTALDLRRALMPPSLSFVSDRLPKKPYKFTLEVFHLHAFLARQHGTQLKAFAYLPHGDLQRIHAYIDTEIARQMLPPSTMARVMGLDAWTEQRDEHVSDAVTAAMAAWDAAHPPSHVGTRQQVILWNKEAKATGSPCPQLLAHLAANPAAREKAKKAAKTAATAAFKTLLSRPRTTDTDLTFDVMMGVDPIAYAAAKDAARKRRRARIRQLLKSPKCQGSGSMACKLRRKLRARAKVGHSALPKGQRFSSMTTDGVSVELVFSTPILEPDEFIAACRSNAADILRRLERRNPKPARRTPEQMQRDFPNPEFVAGDEGRVKLSVIVGAPSHDRSGKPETRIVYTRKAYYNDIDHKRRTRAELARRTALGLDGVYTALGADGAARKTTNRAAFERYLDVEGANSVELIAAGVIDTFHARDGMLGYRLGRSSLDRYARRLVTQGDKSRPLVIGIGSAKFASTGRGEMAAPTTKVARAVDRAILRMKAHRRILLLTIDEFRTTLCDCETLRITDKKQVPKREIVDGVTVVNGTRESGRLRVLQNSPHARGRDRDVQAARNILLLTMNEFLGLKRPWPLRRETSRGSLVAWSTSNNRMPDQ